MKSSWERLLVLPTIKSKETAKQFTDKCYNEDWGHTFGLNQNNQTINVAWRFRKQINEQLRDIRKQID